ncbi:MAG: calcineurin-like phosphoesterase family protein [Melioribacteraceae bacterium]|nr:calcineurin-like phosphoesterase family protein [Melioribacteraceae bacterium]
MIKRRAFLKTAAFSSAALVLPQVTFSEPQLDQADLLSSLYIRINGVVSVNGKPLKDVVVSDGETVMATDDEGKYEFITKNRFVFISIPSGYKIPQNDTGTALFYREIDKRKKMAFYPFELEKSVDDTEHSFILFADPQTEDEEDMQKFHNETIPDLQKLLKDENLKNVFGLSDGDIMYDQLELYPKYEEAVKKMGIPFFQVLGNHDVIETTQTDEQSVTTFENHFGPTYFSFNRGRVHYVVLDDIFWFGEYIGYVNQKMLDWLKRDLAFVEEGRSVIIFTHIPPHTTYSKRYELDEEVNAIRVVNKELLYDLLKPYKSIFVCGHTHESQYITDGNSEVHVCGAVCGGWWTGPICYDGTPNGYSIYKINGDKISWQYKSTGLPLSHQLRIYKPNSEHNTTDELIANVWGYDKHWKVEWYEDGVLKGEMENRIGFDPFSVTLHDGDDKPVKRTWVNPVKNDHMFYAKPSKSAMKLSVKVTDRWGRVFEENV